MLCSRFWIRSWSAASSAGPMANENAASPVALSLGGEVDDGDGRQARAAGAVGQREQLVLAGRGVRPALQARRRAAQYHHRPFRARAHDRDLARVVARRLALLVARLVLLVHDDRAEVLHR